jgi:hypothetical protein
MQADKSLIPTHEELSIIQTIAKTAVDSKYFDKLGGHAGIVMIALYAKEIGVPVVTAIMGGMQNVMGKITMSAELMNSLIRKAGHKVEIKKCDSNSCIIQGIRKDTGEGYLCTFTIEDARKAGLIKGAGGYEKYADDMLFARCISKLKRRLFPDIADRAYVHGEIEEVEKKEEISEADVEILDQSTGEIKKISIQQAVQIEGLIGKDEEYRQNLHKFFKIRSFEELDLKKFDSLKEAIVKHNEMIKKKETTEKDFDIDFIN